MWNLSEIGNHARVEKYVERGTVGRLGCVCEAVSIRYAMHICSLKQRGESIPFQIAYSTVQMLSTMQMSTFKSFIIHKYRDSEYSN